MQNDKVAVVIITYNRLELLKKVLDAVKGQTRKADEIIVVNNSSTDGTEDWLNEQDGIYHLKQENVGSSGGQYAGFKKALEGNFDYVWTMDDDVVPMKDCLAALLHKANQITVVTPLRFKSETEVYLNDVLKLNLKNPFSTMWEKVISESELKNGLIAAQGITFEGPLVPMELIRKAGLPNKDFFIYGDDTEYFIRCMSVGAEIYLYSEAHMLRLLPAADQEKDYGWKLYYIIRNQMLIDLLHGTFAVRLIRPIAYLFKWLGRVNNSDERKTVFKAFKDAYKLASS